MSDPLPSPESREGALHDEVTSLIRTRRFRQAVTLCGQAMSEFPRASWPRTLSAYAHFHIGQNETTIVLAAESLAMGSAEVTALVLLGRAHARLGNYAASAQALERAYEKLPDRVDIAAALLEQTAKAYGMTTARYLFERLSRAGGAPIVTSAWARLQFRVGRTDLPPGYIAGPLLSAPAWAASRGVKFDWAAPPFPIPWEEPIVVGEANRERRRGEYLSYAPYVLTLRDATIFSKSNMVLTADGAVLNDTTADEEFGQFVTNFRSDLAVVERHDDRMLLNIGQYELKNIDACLHMSGSVSEYIGHWTSEYLLRLHYMRHHPKFTELPVVVDEKMPAQHLEYLRLIIDNPIVTLPPRQGLKCKELVVVAPISFFPVHPTGEHIIPRHRIGALSAAAYEFLRERATSRLPAPGPCSRRIYLVRGKRPWRSLLNEDEISTHLATRGFELVDPGEMSAAQQIKTFQEAQVIVAPVSSALMNTVFCQSGTQIIVLAQRGVFNWTLYCAWMAERGCGVVFVCGPDESERKHDDYSISVDDLDKALAETEAS